MTLDDIQKKYKEAAELMKDAYEYARWIRRPYSRINNVNLIATSTKKDYTTDQEYIWGTYLDKDFQTEIINLIKNHIDHKMRKIISDARQAYDDYEEMCKLCGLTPEHLVLEVDLQ